MVREKDMKEGELKRWLQANLLELEEEWQVRRNDFSLRDFIQGEAYANVFGGHPYKRSFQCVDGEIHLKRFKGEQQVHPFRNVSKVIVGIANKG
jgi:hypothetical protein